ncbi:MAG: hypothetical protein K2Y28_09495 [Burkholderiaceae bacterium]|nr:hypothetical protein [Burkholderiaceae bacterium]
MDIQVDAISAGTKVFVQLGYLTVKHGLVIGHRVTVSNAVKPKVEYLIRWFGHGDRKEQEEWFESARVRKTPEEAFQL